MTINGLNPALASQLPSSPASVDTAGASGGSFGSVVRDAVESLDKTQQASAQAMAQAVTGESPDLHRTIIALQTADLGFQFALQVRNKVMDAYQEIMRMQV
jgi:flagellar hook-basal body complex protein FliE